MSKFTQSNKAGWDGLAETHYRNYHTDRLLAGKPLLNEVIKSEVGEVTGKELVHLLCHIGTDTLSWALLGARVTGIDISSESLKYARKLADKMGIEADFIEADIMEVRNKVQSKYDLAFCSTGAFSGPKTRPAAVAEQRGRFTWIFFVMFDGSLQRAKNSPCRCRGANMPAYLDFLRHD